LRTHRYTGVCGFSWFIVAALVASACSSDGPSGSPSASDASTVSDAAEASAPADASGHDAGPDATVQPDAGSTDAEGGAILADASDASADAFADASGDASSADAGDAGPPFTREVTFGDSLSDVGTYAVGTVAALNGGKYTVNSIPASRQNWTELMAARFGLKDPCAAETGLNGSAAAGFNVAPISHSACFNYAQGGARVTDPNGVGSATLDASLGGSTVLGQLAVPVVTQIQNFLLSHTRFTGTEIVFVMAGANDVFVQLSTLKANATTQGQAAANAQVAAKMQADITAGTCVPNDAGGSNCQAQAEGELWQASYASQSALNAAVAAQVQVDVTAGTCTLTDAGTPPVGCTYAAEAELVTAYLTAQATAAAAAWVTSTGGPAAVAAMSQAGTELAGYVNNQIIANGAKYVTVLNLPDIGTTPFGLTLDSSTLSLVNTMVSTFDTQLQNGMSASSSVLYIDVNTQSHLNTQTPLPNGITNATTPACDLTSSANPLASALVCTTSNTIAGDVSHYLFADTVHPTPYGNSLLAKYVTAQMTARGWL
jgi:phospholipase/lecithinase/hemolysin